MAFFNFRFPGHKTGGAVGAAPAESVEGLRRRARHRLIGAAVLVLVAVIGFPLVFDTQPRPVAVDVAIQIPDRAKSKPLVMPSADPQGAASRAGAMADVAATKSPASAGVVGPSQVAPRASLDAREEIVTGSSESKQAQPSVKLSSPAINTEVARGPASAPRAELKPEAKAEAKPPAARPADDGSRARALLDGKDVAPPAAVDGQRFIVQVGAFSDPAKARETRLKVERAGLTTYTQVVDTPEGKRTRVRVGPFASRAEADKAAARIQGLELPAAILTL
jgi:DedD protein